MSQFIMQFERELGALLLARRLQARREFTQLALGFAQPALALFESALRMAELVIATKTADDIPLL